ncbi:WD40-repeat-containing domain protein [Suillus paluster]|uniref:WD40-repeat-containing domain protein n=1 Tax=Suillus paluster TaxID=48578 RepID=UPI001B881E01|nr:WD40-repeat-containing domain protein [Suillus paluster]KAG1723722.1 WD40-repeat-containing domain protein [Suillus paluster]
MYYLIVVGSFATHRSHSQDPDPDPSANSDIAKPTSSGQTFTDKLVSVNSYGKSPIMAEQLDPTSVNERIADATKRIAGIKNISGIFGPKYYLVNQQPPVFNTVANGLADVHPYVKVALSILTCASKMVLGQARHYASSFPLQVHTSYIQSLAISPDGKHIVSGSADKTIRVSDAETGKSVAISPDAKCVVSGSDDKTIRVWDLGTSKKLRTLRGHTDCVQSVAISPDSTLVVSGSSDKMIRVWDIKTGKPLGDPLGGHTSNVLSVAMANTSCLVQTTGLSGCGT